MKKTLLLGALTLALLLGSASFAAANTVVYPGIGDPAEASGTVTVKALVGCKLELTIDTPDAAGQIVDFGLVFPNTTNTGQSVDLNVKSNMPYKLTEVITNPTALPDDITVTTNFASLGDLSNEPATASADYTSDYTLDVPWTAADGAHTATVLYTATQL